MKYEKDKLFKVKEEYRKLERQSKLKQEHMVKTEKENRDLKELVYNLKKKGLDYIGSDGNDKVEKVKSDQKIDELQRVANGLLKQREKDGKLTRMNKKVHEKNIEEMQDTILKLQEQMKAKDKDIKMQAMKLREMISMSP